MRISDWSSDVCSSDLLSHWMWWDSIFDAIMALTGDVDKYVRVVAPSPRDAATRIEVVLPTAPLTEALRDFSWRILTLSLLISIAAGGLVYFSLQWWMVRPIQRSEEHTSELQSLMRISYAVFCLKKKTL